ncbi:hypothetical protein T492DRAFT_1064644 [Pavlovales sp. CCMP2436]|nr:hypothetical protein T492DRAFT_1064644 [Pavlovales sp. CCMP2436]
MSRAARSVCAQARPRASTCEASKPSSIEVSRALRRSTRIASSATSAASRSRHTLRSHSVISTVCSRTRALSVRDAASAAPRPRSALAVSKRSAASCASVSSRRCTRKSWRCFPSSSLLSASPSWVRSRQASAAASLSRSSSCLRFSLSNECCAPSEASSSRARARSACAQRLRFDARAQQRCTSPDEERTQLPAPL